MRFPRQAKILRNSPYAAHPVKNRGLQAGDIVKIVGIIKSTNFAYYVVKDDPKQINIININDIKYIDGCSCSFHTLQISGCQCGVIIGDVKP